MRKTNTLTRVSTYALILAGLGLTTPILSTAEDQPVTAKLTLSAEMDPFIETELNARRERVRNGEPATVITEWPGLKSNLIEVNYSGTTVADTVVRDISGNVLTGSDKDAVLSTVQSAVSACASHATQSPASSQFSQISGQNGLVYSATCKPNAADTLSSTDAEIAALMASESLPMGRRLAKARGMKARELIAAFQVSNSAPTRSEYFDYCVDTTAILNEGYRFENQPIKSAAEIDAVCETRTAKRY